ncbi:MAG: hypothetical protein MJ062_01615 [Oscillospiraceae bacterium]|nr:hypothetical protein [Oscillospiraceae bacterium]
MAARLSGKKTATIDARGRMSFPAQYLAKLGSTLYVTPDTEGLGYLLVNSEEGYDEFCNELKENFRGNKLKQVNRHCLSATETLEPDKLGRISIPEALCKHAGLTGKVAIIGVGDYAEIWDEERFLADDAEKAESTNALMAEVM